MAAIDTDSNYRAKAHVCKYVSDRGPKLCASDNSLVFSVGRISVICCLLMDTLVASDVDSIMIHAYGFKSHPSCLSKLANLPVTSQ